jgi:hypothetical protein
VSVQPVQRKLAIFAADIAWSGTRARAGAAGLLDQLHRRITTIGLCLTQKRRNYISDCAPSQ